MAAAGAVAIACVFSPFTARAGFDMWAKEPLRPWTPIGFSVFTPYWQMPNLAHSVFGVMLNFGYGRVRDVYCLNAGLFNYVYQDMAGMQLGLLNAEYGEGDKWRILSPYAVLPILNIGL